jgi:hypothetical protein
VGLEAGRRVDVGDRDDIGDAGLLELVPAGVDVIGGGHVGHGAAGGHVGQHHDLVGAGEDVRRLGHEVHAAEDDVLLVSLLGGPAGQLQGVAAVVGELDDVLPLVVVAEDDQPRRELGLGGVDTLHELLGVQGPVFGGDVLLPEGEGRLLGQGGCRQGTVRLALHGFGKEEFFADGERLGSLDLSDHDGRLSRAGT